MTNREAVAATIEPYSVSDNGLDKALCDAGERFGEYSPEGAYTPAAKKAVALASMLVLSRLRTLQAENIGGISQNFAVAKIEKTIRAIAEDAGISAELVLAEDGEAVVTCISI